jgi:hypothetical protein
MTLKIRLHSPAGHKSFGSFDSFGSFGTFLILERFPSRENDPNGPYGSIDRLD